MAVKLFFRFGTWVFLVPLLLGLLLGWLAQSEADKARLLDREAVEAKAIIHAMYTGSRRGGQYGGGAASRSHSIVYDYEAAGRSIQAEQGVTEEFFRNVRVGDEVAVFYAPSDPSVSEIERGHAETGAAWISWVAALSLLVSAALAWWRLRVFAAARRAAQAGIKRRTTVASTEKSSAMFGRQSRLRLVWRAAKGGHARSRRLRRTVADQWPVGAEITVVSDPMTGREWLDSDLR